jgi:hypothetical protein
LRRISTYGDGPSQQVADVLQALFVGELLSPSRDVWVVSPWLSDIPVLDNRGGEFAVLLPGASSRTLSLVDVLVTLAERGTRLHVVTRQDPSNQPVLQRLRAARALLPAIDISIRERIHEKGLLTSRLYLEGSMNFTHAGRERNEEGLSVNSDRDYVASMHVDFSGRFAEPGEVSNRT